ncbi:recombinase family protein [Mycobacterium sp. AZCC_0083]|uniref:recombinase family protein n=1 Tax=Mycobacterium sp. AZCC_0083 TaxID=2735882 RepID=UPI0016111054|nr:recombinase family protein [Mycobacterium sp. AZCC_0083]MBB5167105.1 DNA invertase Pin-like site-specific DNA recombinase [Mycobacterium sp. AZCC_0083]
MTATLSDYPPLVAVPTVRAAMYLRMSHNKDVVQLGVDRQREDLEPLCQGKNWVWTEYVDDDKTAVMKNGVMKKRPAYQRMLQDIRDGKIDAVAVWDLDRLHREPLELEEFIHLADVHRLGLASVDTNVDLSTDSGRLFARIKGAVAKAEVERKSARQIRAMKQMADLGKGWGRRTFGYEHDHAKPQLRPMEADAIRQAYADVLAGASLYRIAEQWNAMGLRTTQSANLWDGTSVGRTLRNPRNAGLRTYHGKIVTTVREDGTSGGDWPAIVDRETWEAAQTVMSSVDKQWGKDRTRKRLLGGILICGECKKGVGTGKRSDGTAIYRCKTQGCYGVARSADPLDEWVEVAFIDALEKRTLAAAKQKDNTALLNEVRAEEARLNSKLEALEAKWNADRITDDQFDRMNADLASQLRTAEARRESLTQAMVIDENIDPDDIAGSFGALDVDRKRATIKRLCSGILVPKLGKDGKKFPVGHGVKILWNERKPKKG